MIKKLILITATLMATSVWSDTKKLICEQADRKGKVVWSYHFPLEEGVGFSERHENGFKNEFYTLSIKDVGEQDGKPFITIYTVIYENTLGETEEYYIRWKDMTFSGEKVGRYGNNNCRF